MNKLWGNAVFVLSENTFFYAFVWGQWGNFFAKMLGIMGDFCFETFGRQVFFYAAGTLCSDCGNI